METGFLDRLATQLKRNKTAACRRAIQRILVRMKEHCASGQYQSTTDAENEFRRLVDTDLACK
jgi:DNA-binding GntR family transcriptional regulator